VLTTGTRLGPYEVLSPLGSGGMGEVYRARDTRLNRTVALKVLAPVLATDAGLRARFEREARAIAALSHSHICTIHDVGEHEGTPFLVMELLDGQTLAARLEQGALPLDQALTTAREIADALDKAHRQGIVHRDLKPANVMLTRTGAKLLDFGLAKLMTAASPLTRSTPAGPGATTIDTAHGTILGTVPYMAPEQVEGKDADARSDVWALGAVLYEMVTGGRPFTGDSPASVISAILKDTPVAPSAKAPLVPPTLEHVIDRCLAKDPERRWQSAGDLALEIDWIARSPHPRSGPAVGARRSPRAAVLSALGSAAVVSAWFLLRLPADATPQASDPVAFTVSPPRGLEFVGTSGSVSVPQLAVSPDGRHLVFVAAGPRGRAALWLRTLTEPDPRQLMGTEDAEVPFWAPDSRSVAFFSQGFVKRKDITNRAPAEVVTNASVDVRGGAWGDGETIVFSQTGTTGLRSVVADGRGDTVSLELSSPVTSPSTAGQAGAGSPAMFETARWPSFLPDDRLLFMIRHPSADVKGVYVARRDGGAPRRVIGSDFAAQYSAGHLLTLNGPTLVAQPFDPRTERTTGPSVPIAQPVAGSSTGYPAFSASPTGVLAYSAGLFAPTELWTFDRKGTRIRRVAPAADYPDFSFSPDGRRLAFSRTVEQWQAPDIWVMDLERGTESRLTSDPLTETMPVWSPGGDAILFRANRAQSANLAVWRMAPNSGAVPESIFSADDQRRAHAGFIHNVFSTDWSADGRFVVYHRPESDGGYDIWALSLDGQRRLVPVTRSRYNEVQAEVSPDSRWVAYASDESGRFEVYVQAFPDAAAGVKTTISVGGGLQPHWSPDGRELYYLGSDGTLMAVGMRTDGARLSAGASTALFQTNLPAAMNAYRSDYAVAPGGQGFLVKVAAEGTQPPTITVILNWPALLKRVPTN